jgi:hypothetical protein
VLSYNYISGTNVRVVIDVVSVMAAYATIINIGTIGTRYEILAKHWMWLPDDSFM